MRNQVSSTQSNFSGFLFVCNWIALLSSFHSFRLSLALIVRVAEMLQQFVVVVVVVN